MSWCNRCGDLMLNAYGPRGLFRSHTCPPAWRVWCIDDGETEEDARTVYATHAEAAAEKWAEQLDQGGNYLIVGGAVMTVGVRQDTGEGEAAYFVVGGEAVPSYHAKPMKLDDFKRHLRFLVRCGNYREAGRLYGWLFTMDFERSET